MFKSRQKLIDQRDDLEYYLSKWGFGMTPSQKRAMREKIDNLNIKISKKGK